MGIFDQLKERAAAAAKGRLEANYALLDGLPPNTVWAANAEWDDGRGGESHGRNGDANQQSL